jgi:hypothetical protein
MGLSNLMKQLRSEGCFPSIYRRGDLWRAHVNAAGNYWHDDTTPLKAMQEAVRLWKRAGKPVDGMATDAEGGE